jgi:hypothetical protein
MNLQMLKNKKVNKKKKLVFILEIILLARWHPCTRVKKNTEYGYELNYLLLICVNEID